jgi:ketosteroid isomerase-like protein
MKPVFVAISFLCTGILCSQNANSPQPAQLPSVALPPELARVLTDYEHAWNNGDSEALSKLFAEDGFVLGSESPIVHGRENIARFYAGSHSSLSLRAIAFAADGNLGYIIGGFGRPGGPDRGKFTVVLRKNRSGTWLIESDMDNNNTHR